MRLTKSVALQLCEDLWGWLALNPEKGKEEWPGWEANGGTVPEMPYDCPCCGYGTQIAGRTKEEVEKGGIEEDECKCCPLARFWPTGRCLNKQSPFMIWDGTNPRGRFGPLIRIGYATMIAGAARQERERLEHKAKGRKLREV